MRCKSNGSKYLCLSALEKTCTVYTGQHSDIAGQRADLVKGTPVNTNMLTEKIIPYDLLLKLIDRFTDIRKIALVCLCKISFYLLGQYGNLSITDTLVIGKNRKSHVIPAKSFNVCKNFFRYGRRLVCEFGLTDLSNNAGNKADNFLDRLVSDFDCGEHCLVFHFIGAGLNHADLLHRSGKGNIHAACASLFLSRVDDNFITDQAKYDTAGRTVPRNIRSSNGN